MNNRPAAAAIPLLLGLLFPSAAFGQQSPSLVLFLFKSELFCLPEFGAFDIYDTVDIAIDYTSLFSDGILPASAINSNQRLIMGCDLRGRFRALNIINALEDMKALAASKQSFTVFIGPPNGGDCQFVSDWVVQDSVADGDNAVVSG